MFRTSILMIISCTTSVIAADGPASRGRVFDALRPISAVTADIRPSVGVMPERNLLPANQALPERYLGMTYCWQATNISYAPLVFEEYNLERHGHSIGCLQPLASGVHFLGSAATLPLTAAFYRDCQYELGHTRPGSCAPFVVVHDGKKLGKAVAAALLIL